MSTLLDSLPSGLPIGDAWVDTDETSTVVFPFDGSTVGEAPVGTVAQAEQSLTAAEGVRRALELATVGQRRAVLLGVADAVRENIAELESLLILETGKPLVDCRVEVARTLSTWEAAAEEVGHLVGETVPLDLQPAGQGMIGFFQRRPAGVVVGIAGFNYPLLLASHKVAPAIGAGCPVICKPAPQTPLATLWLAKVVREQLAANGLPQAACQLVTGGVDVGDTLVTDPRAAVVSFTGSATVGHLIARNAAPRKALLELGSNTALIVAADADLDRAVDAVIRGGFYANGQACISVQRLLVDRQVAEDFLSRLQKRLPEVIVGDPRDEATRVAPVIDQRSRDRIASWLADAVERGARVLDGEDGSPGEGAFRPTLVTGVPRDAELWREEIFGPIVCVTEVADLDEAIEIANDSRYGLQGAVYTASLATAFDVIDRLQVGGVVVNEIPGFRSDVMPYGGVKDSGIGREGPRWAMEEFTVTKMALIRPA
ncbi:aldehyde dehydrogenase [Enemella dayhoffiae]|uniref:Aldehyde dehydrogenase n=1 Tax=Enemella dayhoffiae TaxID=2016507 RepID=A0A255HA77_9ACTN|nr:aldehyde dehydrogenase family protein [Enemella dayhoffiae]OYO24487.1 aldehyde dehydrogenase [Enemella dayhoffiae]